MSGAFRPAKDGVLLFVRVTPNARKSGVDGLWSGPDGAARLALKVAAPPDRGRANKAIVETLAAALALPKSRFSITAGEKDRLKTVSIVGDSVAIGASLAALIDALGRSGP